MKSIALAALVAGALAIPAGPLLAQEATTEQNGQTMTWQNPERIADIQDESERIRAYSVLVGQSVYDQMLKAGEATNSGGSSVQEINIVVVTEALTPEDVSQIEQAAESNKANIQSLQDNLELQPDVKEKLDEAGVLPADVVGAQLSQGGVLDLFVIPDWLSK